MLSRVNLILQSAEMALGCVLLFLLLSVATVNIVCRYFFGIPLIWAEELSNYLFVWIGLLASTYVLAKSEHISITFVRDRLPEKVRVVLDILINVLLIVFLLSFLTPSIRALNFVSDSPALHISGVYTRMIVPITFVLMILHLLFNIGKQISRMVITFNPGKRGAK